MDIIYYDLKIYIALSTLSSCLKAQYVTFTWIEGYNMEKKIHWYIFSLIKLLKRNNSLTISTSIYITSVSTYKRRPYCATTFLQQPGLWRVSRFYRDTTAGKTKI